MHSSDARQTHSGPRRKSHFPVRKSWWFFSLSVVTFATFLTAAENNQPNFKDVQPILTKYCYDCHADGMDKGQVAFDVFKSQDELVNNHDLWLRVLKNVRAGVMPPEKKPHPTPEEKHLLESWIKN